MTNWTTLVAWSPNAVPTAAELNAQLRDNLLHLYEQIDGFGYPYAPADPRFLGTTTASYPHSYPKYSRVTGRGPVATLRARVKATAGTVAWGVYRNDPTTDLPANRAGTTTLLNCPAIGQADIALFVTVDVVEPGDWFAMAGTSTSATLEGRNTIGFELQGHHISAVSTDTNITDLPERADVNLDTSGTPHGPYMVGLP
jgi:hypothetical protein